MGRARIVVDRDDWLGEHAPIPASVVKSAGRVLQILEFFDDVQHSATVREISEVLDYPQSSTSILLRSMVVMGYLAYDGMRRTYRPTARVSMLGAWVNREVVAPGPVLEMMAEINRASGGLVVLAARTQLHARYVHVVQGRCAGRLVLGTMRTLIGSGMGNAILCQLPDAEIRQIVLRSNAELRGTGEPIRLSAVMDAMAALRRDGFTYAEGRAVAGRAVIAMPLPPIGDPQPYSLGVAGPVEDLVPRRMQIVQAMQGAIARYLPPARVDSAA